jgi:hypothetical protein
MVGSYTQKIRRVNEAGAKIPDSAFPYECPRMQEHWKPGFREGYLAAIELIVVLQPGPIGILAPGVIEGLYTPSDNLSVAASQTGREVAVEPRGFEPLTSAVQRRILNLVVVR